MTYEVDYHLPRRGGNLSYIVAGKERISARCFISSEYFSVLVWFYFLAPDALFCQVIAVVMTELAVTSTFSQKILKVK